MNGVAREEYNGHQTEETSGEQCDDIKYAF